MKRQRIREISSSIIKEVVAISAILFKIMIPISIIIKILKELNLIPIFGDILSPFMQIVGLPGEYGIVWATSMLTNMYGGMVVFYSILPTNPITITQATVLGAMILVAHSFPVEITIAKKAGVRTRATFILRFFGAILLGWIIYIVYSILNIYQDALKLSWIPEQTSNDLKTWIINEAKNYLLIIVIILLLVVFMRIIKKIGIISWSQHHLSPALKILGLGEEAATLTIVGLSMGISYGGGMIIHEAKSGKLKPREIFLSIALLSLCHSLVEDTLLMMAIGSTLPGILLGRVIFSLIAILILARITAKISTETLHRYFVSGSLKPSSD